MPLLTLAWVEGRPHLEVDGITVKNVSLVAVEIEANQQPVIQIEMSPDDAVTVLGHGRATWIVTCPSCHKDTHHTCTLEDGRELGVVEPVPVAPNFGYPGYKDVPVASSPPISTFGPGGDNVPLVLPSMPLPPEMPAEDQ